MTKDKAVTMSRELIEIVAKEMDRLGYGHHEHHAESILHAIRSAAPVVERQDIGIVSLDLITRILLILEQRDFKWHTDDPEDEVRDLVRSAMNCRIFASPPAPVSVVLPTREVMRDLIAEVIGGDAYDCTRVWSAWGVGTMSEDDFVPVVEQEERLYELADACLDKVKELNQ